MMNRAQPLLLTLALLAAPASAGSTQECDAVLNLMTVVMDARRSGIEKHELRHLLDRSNPNWGYWEKIIDRIYWMPQDSLRGKGRMEVMTKTYEHCRTFALHPPADE